MPLTRLLGSVKIRLAQINTDIGVIKNQIKTGATHVTEGSGPAAKEESKQLARVVTTFVDAIT